MISRVPDVGYIVELGYSTSDRHVYGPSWKAMQNKRREECSCHLFNEWLILAQCCQHLYSEVEIKRWKLNRYSP